MQVAVVGAGVAGVTVARFLAEAGMCVTVYDKSKGTGGRLSSRHVNSGWIDHGAPFFSCESAGFRKFLQQFVSSETCQQWNPSLKGKFSEDEKTGFIGVPRNSAITRSLLGDICFQPSTRIARLIKRPSGWRLENDGGSIVGSSEAVIVAVPSPQALSLLRELPQFSDIVRQSQMEPCWVTAIETLSALPGWAEVTAHEHPVLRRVVFNSAKPGRNNQNVYSLYAAKNWSETYLEETSDWVGKQMAGAFEEVANAACQTKVLFTHRWRYAFTTAPLDRSCLWDHDSQLGVCGDWFLGRCVEDAWKSAETLARKMLQAPR